MKPPTLQELWQEIECSYTAVQAATSVAADQSVADSYQLCHKAVVILNTCSTFSNSISASADAYEVCSNNVRTFFIYFVWAHLQATQFCLLQSTPLGC
jgi:hypothetical protein